MKVVLYRIGLFWVSWLLLSTSLFATIVDVYVYNTEFSTNPPGDPIVQATITEGDSIRWTLLQGNHTTTAVMGSTEQWDTTINASHPEFIRQFNTAGVYWYYCRPHGTDNMDGTASGMSGTITVLPIGSGACCLPDGLCVSSTESGCTAQNGTFSGIGSLCDTSSCAVVLEITAAQDNILYETVDGDISNGMGIYLYAGNNNDGKRRPVLAFDVGTIPSGAEVDSARLTVYCNSSSGTSTPVSLQRLLQDWGEGVSDATGNEGTGAPAEPGDATWLHTFHDTAFWTDAGGSFAPDISATTEVDAQNTYYSWTDSLLNADVQQWIDDPVYNFGWILRGDENSTANTKRFASRQNTNADEHPRLSVHYQVPPDGACCLPDGTCQELTERLCSVASGIYQGDGTSCSDITCSVLLTPYLDSLPIPAIATPVTGNPGGSAHYRIAITEEFQQLHSDLPPTRIWGYDGLYPGPTIEAHRDSLVTVTWINNLKVFETEALRDTHVLHVDTCIHGPNMTGVVPVTVAHLHGGKVPPDSDGYPEDTFPPGDSSQIYHYPNIQPAGILWYHDHALGITRLNVLMGLAGFYLIRDSVETSLNLPSGAYEIPLVIQDRSFNADGSFQYPETLHDHFFGNTIVVNGKVWPYLNVRQGKYRFRLLNGSNSRAYTLQLSNGGTFALIGAELGLLNTPVFLDSLTMLPGERYDVIIDFAPYPDGTEILLTNSAPAPFPGFPGVGVVPEVMKFIVLDSTGYTAPIPDTLAYVEELQEVNSERERLFNLYTTSAPPCNGQTHQMWTINGMMWGDITEFPVMGSTEIWTWHNTSGISHPMHMHLVAFQVLDRQAINAETGEPEGPLIEPGASEKGWKDTVNSPPGYRTRVIARFDGFQGLFPYHCHILEHEDHEMMRQYELNSCLLVTNTDDSGPGSFRYAVLCATDGDTIQFHTRLAGDTIRLDSTLVLDKDLIIDNSIGTLVVSGVNTTHVFSIGFGEEVVLRHLDLISGSGPEGRALINYGDLYLDDITIYQSVLDPMNGNTILNLGTLTTQGNCSFFFSEE